MLWNLCINETVKLLRRALYWVELGVFLGLCLLLFTVLVVLVQSGGGQTPFTPGQLAEFRQSLTWPGALYAAIKFTGAPVGPLLVIILVATVTAQEYVWRTVNLAVGSGVPRTRVLTAKLLSIFVALLGWMVILLLFAGALSAVIGSLIQGAPDFSAINFGHVGLSMIRGIYAQFPVIALTFFLALATRSTVTAIGIAAGYFVVFETLLVQMLSILGNGLVTRITSFLPGMLSMGLLQANEMEAVPAGGSFLLAPDASAALIAVFTMILLVLSFLLFRRQDLPS
jgi:ABC-type transport system involved in multi-copper enzyme maturation permease subunit